MNAPRSRTAQGLLYRLFRAVIRASGRNLGAHAIIPDPSTQRVLVVRSRVHGAWGFPGGGVRRGESVAEAVARECREELGVPVSVDLLSGIYYSRRLDTHAMVFRCTLLDHDIRLSIEHSEFRYVEVNALPPQEAIRAADALGYEGYVRVRALP